MNPERLCHEKRTGERISAKTGTKTKKWLTSGFRVEISGLPCENVFNIESFTLKQTLTEDHSGKTRERTQHPTKIEVPNIKLTFSATDGSPWENWFNSFVIEGKCADGDELKGEIMILGPNHKSVLGKIELLHVGIMSLQPTKYNAKKGRITRMEAKLYVEEMKFVFNEADA